MQIALTTNDVGGVTKVTFTYTDPDGNDHSTEFDPPAVHPIVACELNFVGPGNYANANFTQGLTSSRGLIYYSVSSGQLSVQNGGAGAACGEAGFITGETSNMIYSDISNAPGSTVTQTLQQSVSCAIDSLMAGDQTRLQQMQQIRDSQLAHHPAGQWLVELLDRHSADLALLIASDSGRLAQDVRDLLIEATDTAREGRVFEGTTIDRARDALRQLSCKLPSSMKEADRAGETLLESLRGRTLEDGLKRASTTIRPRSQPLQRPCDRCCERLAQRVGDLEERVRRLESR